MLGKLTIWFAASAIVLTPWLARAEDGAPFPALRFEEYCNELVSKMLDKGEQAKELVGCLTQEFKIRALLEPAWPSVPPAEQQKINERFAKPPQPRKPRERNFQTHTELYRDMMGSIGTACIRKVLRCVMP